MKLLPIDVTAVEEFRQQLPSADAATIQALIGRHYERSVPVELIQQYLSSTPFVKAKAWRVGDMVETDAVYGEHHVLGPLTITAIDGDEHQLQFAHRIGFIYRKASELRPAGVYNPRPGGL